MSDFGYSYGNPGGGFRIRPDGKGGILYIRPGNVKLLDIPARDRVLEVVCRGERDRHQPRLVAIVTTDGQLHALNNSHSTAMPGQVFTQCRCGPDGHALELVKIKEAMERLRHRPRKGRTVDVQSLAPAQPVLHDPDRCDACRRTDEATARAMDRERGATPGT